MTLADNSAAGAETPSPFNRGAQELLDAGYHPIPLMPRDKCPGEYKNGRWTPMVGWTGYSLKKPDMFTMRKWSSWPDANIGIAMGTRCNGYQLVAIDYDTEDYDKLTMLSSCVPPSPFTKRGARGFTGLYLADPSVKTAKYTIQKQCILEILTGNKTRQTVMPPSLHPFGATYSYQNGGKITPIHMLPVLTQDHIEKLEDTLEHLGWNGEKVESIDRETSDSDPNIWRETNNVALQNLDAWVPLLGLYKLRRTGGGGGYEAVNIWRPSCTGQPLEKRKSNLKFHASGIKDMGTDLGYSALDIVQTTFNWDFDTTFVWLRSKIGLGDDASVLNLPTLLTEEEDGTIWNRETGEVIKGGPSVASVTSNSSDAFEDSIDALFAKRKAQDAPKAEAPKAEAQAKAPDPSDNNSDELPESLTRPMGLLGEVTDWITNTARKPNRVISLSAAIPALGTLMGRRTAGPTKAGTSLYVLSLALTGAGKQHGLDQQGLMLEEADARELIGPGEFMSMPSVINFMKRAPLSLCGMDEFGAFLKRINARNASGFEGAIKKVMLTAWGTNYRLMMTPEYAGRAAEAIQAPALSIYGASTPESFYDALDGTDIENGVLNRFLILKTNKRAAEIEPPLDPLTMPDELRDQLRKLYTLDGPGNVSGFSRLCHDTRIAPQIVGWDDVAKKIYGDFGNEIEKIYDTKPELSPFVARSAEMAIRLATIHAVGRNMDDPLIEKCDMQWGRDLAFWSATSMSGQTRDYMSETDNQEMVNRIVRTIKTHGGTMGHTDLLKALKHRLKSRDLKETLSYLRDAETLATSTVTPAGGGPAKTVYTLLKR